MPVDLLAHIFMDKSIITYPSCCCAGRCGRRLLSCMLGGTGGRHLGDPWMAPRYWSILCWMLPVSLATFPPPPPPPLFKGGCNQVFSSGHFFAFSVCGIPTLPVCRRVFVCWLSGLPVVDCIIYWRVRRCRKRCVGLMRYGDGKELSWPSCGRKRQWEKAQYQGCEY